MEETTRRKTVQLTCPELHRRIKVLAAKNGMTISEVIGEAIRLLELSKQRMVKK